MSEYYKLLKDPRWQKKRLQVLESESFACIECDNTEKTLHVHHTIYRKGKNPWEYPDHELHVLCEDCHKERHDAQNRLKEILAGGMTSAYLNAAGHAVGSIWANYTIGEIGIKELHPDFVEGFCGALHLNESRVWAFLMKEPHRLSYKTLMDNINQFRL